MGKKQKKNKSAQKRFKITANNKLMRRPAGQDHFNAKDSGNLTRSKKIQSLVTHKKNAANMKKILPM